MFVAFRRRKNLFRESWHPSRIRSPPPAPLWYDSLDSILNIRLVIHKQKHHQVTSCVRVFPQRQMKELMVRAIYCEMLGYEASFSYIHAIKLAQQGGALEKRVGVLLLNSVEEILYLQHFYHKLLKQLKKQLRCGVCYAGYLAVSLFLNESHELLLLLVNTVLKVSAKFMHHYLFWLSNKTMLMPSLFFSPARISRAPT